ncbi:cysteine hydrolase [Micrococcus antarcticus]|uniref:cysteine hydrolase family protein n=1 Tax=Micrococcus antarcticus TaxID=86171 RepID=UPI0038515F43
MPDTSAEPSRSRPQGPAGEQTALIVVDMQNSYFEFPELAAEQERVLAAVNELLAAARDGGRPVVLVRTEHARDRSTWTLNMLEDDQGFAFPCTEQARLLTDLQTEGCDTLEIVKTRDSAFHGTSLAEDLRQRGVGRVLLCGISTHSCVAQTAINAFAHQFHAAVAVDAVASEDPDLSTALLRFLEKEMRQPMLDQSAAVAALRGDGPTSAASDDAASH